MVSSSWLFHCILAATATFFMKMDNMLYIGVTEIEFESDINLPFICLGP